MHSSGAIFGKKMEVKGACVVDIDVDSTQEIAVPQHHSPSETDVMVELMHNGNTLEIQRKDLPFSLGRDEEESDLFIPAIVASRHHCMILEENGRLGIVDKSTNGTFVQIGQAEETCLKDEFFPLLGKGMIKLGEPVGCGDKNLIFFRCP